MEQHGEAQREQLRARVRVGEQRRHFREPAAAAEHEQREAMLLLRGEAGHVGVLQDVGAVLVVSDVRDGIADLVEQRRPFDDLRRIRARLGAALEIERLRERGDARRVRAIDVIALDEAIDRRGTDVLVHRAPEQVVQDAEAHRAADRIDSRHFEQGERRRHDRESARKHRHPLRLQARELEPPDVARAHHALAQPLQSLQRDAARRQSVLLEDFRERQRGAGRGVRLAPVLVPELARDRLDFGARVGLGGEKGIGAKLPVGEEALGVADATHLQRLEPLRIEAAADDELRRSPADVDDEPRLARRRQHVRDAEVDEPRFLVPRDDVDRKAERRFRLREELRRIGRDAKRVRRDGAHGGWVQAAQPLAEAREASERGTLRLRRDATEIIQRRAHPQRLAPGIEPEDLVALDATELEPEAVRAHVDDGERRGRRLGARARGMTRARVASGVGTQGPPYGRYRFAANPGCLTPYTPGLPRFAANRMPVDYLQKILTAKVYDVAIETPLELAPTLSRRLGNRVLLKREDEQPVFSFKLRGAYNKMAQLTPAERARGVIAASAGNHAQGVALAAQKLGCAATIVMPVTTPHIKIAAVEARGATVVLHGDSYSDAYAQGARAAASEPRHVRPSVRRSRRDRRTGHDRHGDPAPDARASSTRSSSRSAAAA